MAINHIDVNTIDDVYFREIQTFVGHHLRDVFLEHGDVFHHPVHGCHSLQSRENEINSAAAASHALQPLAGNAAGLLFALGVIGVGFLAVPVMTTGAAYDLCQSLGWKHGLYRKPGDAKRFYVAIAAFTTIAIGMNFFGINPMKALRGRWHSSGLLHTTSDAPNTADDEQCRPYGKRVNGRAINILGWITTATIFAASAGLVISWFV